MSTNARKNERRSKKARRRLTVVILALVVVVGVIIAIVTVNKNSNSDAKGAAQPTTALQESSGSSGADSQAPVVERATTDNPQILAQLDYVNTYWQDYNDDYGVITGNDCVNFTSQSLLQRGWNMDDEWWSDGPSDAFEYSSPWVSSTAFRDYIDESGRATALTDDQRDQVKLGDVVQFDWDNSGDRDHTAVVTRIERSGDTISIYYGGHTDNTDFRSVDWAITENHPGATAYYWSIPE
ncbi:amidase domain-containing protein [Leifsonia sp. A12D58]|uniref:amidase domain-containing protein n=1 Tax=Leifsonia sp. A12D58 TaxID=3397674 RepID=UPI0039DF5EF7